MKVHIKNKQHNENTNMKIKQCRNDYEQETIRRIAVLLI
jgi:hypothetical protein